MNLSRIFIVAGIASVVFSSQGIAEERVPPLPSAMAALGDSLSEALFADFSIETPPTFGQLFEMMTLGNAARTAEKALNIFRARFAVKQHSWSTGDDDADLVESHFKRLRIKNPKIRSYNFAVSGSKSKDIPGQVDELLRFERSQKVSIDYITLMIGANDLAVETIGSSISSLQFIGPIERALRKLLDANPDRAILLVGLPNVFRVFESTHSLNALNILGNDIKCGDMRTAVYGKTILFDSNDPDYPAVQKLYRQYEVGVRALSERLQADYPSAYLKTAQNYDFDLSSIKTLAVDCFHPSVWGHAVIAEFTWKLGFWPNLVTDEEILDH